jgi:hypothetical protein
LVGVIMSRSLVLAPIFATAVLLNPVASQTPAPAPTFNKHVAPILYSNCVTCHRPGEVAPMSLLNYSEVKPWGRAIKEKVLARDMPPWYADPQYGQFRNNRRLAQADIDTLVAWVDADSPEGDGTAPRPPEFQQGWTSAMTRPPDRVLELPFEFQLPANGDVPTFTVWLKLPFREDVFIEAIEFRPGNRSVLHHSSVTVGGLPPGTRLGKAPVWPDGPVVDGIPLFDDGKPFRASSSEEFGTPLFFYVPGGGFQRFPSGIAKRMRAGQYLVWGLHYVTTGKPEKDRSRIGLWFSKRSPHHEAFLFTVNQKVSVEGKELGSDARGRTTLPNIPPRVENWNITGSLVVKEAITLYALWPHMHYRGKDMTFSVKYPNGREETLLSVPRYDPNWQITYELAKPLKIPARSTITAVAHYDNSTKNPRNPGPDQEVTWGPQSWNEMFLPFLEVSVDDQDLRFERLQQDFGR